MTAFNDNYTVKKITLPHILFLLHFVICLQTIYQLSFEVTRLAKQGPFL